MKFENLVKDINAVLENPNHEVSEDNLEILMEDIKEGIRSSLEARKTKSKSSLWASKIGLPLRRLWFDTHSPEPITASNKMTFLYGTLIESLMVFLAREAGHDVTEEQRRVEMDGVSGKKDCRIDGVTTDVKSASSFSFKKFASGDFLAGDDTVDPFGYKAQLGFYMKADNDQEGAFLVVNKENGEMCTNVLSLEHDVPDVNLKIEQAKVCLESDNPPIEFCYPAETRGKSGNHVLHKLCTFCPHKFKCWADCNDGKGLIEYQYARETVYFTKLVKEPRGYGSDDPA